MATIQPATQAMVHDILDGRLPAGKAIADEEGNNISNTYATQTMAQLYRHRVTVTKTGLEIGSTGDGTLYFVFYNRSSDEINNYSRFAAAVGLRSMTQATGFFRTNATATTYYPVAAFQITSAYVGEVTCFSESSGRFTITYGAMDNDSSVYTDKVTAVS